MNKKTYRVIGLMSGTSLDGVDAVYVEFDVDDQIDFKILAAKTYAYTEAWYLKLKNAINEASSAHQELHEAYGSYLGKLVEKFRGDFSIEHVDFIASHGHTVLHQPLQGITLQVGDGQAIAQETGLSVICDFRSQDVRLGGQGAPLVPIGDQLLFSDYQYCLNLGGFSNVSFQADNQLRIAYDICPVNIVMNHYAQQLGFEYDDGGKLASKGKVYLPLLDKLNALAYYQQKPPKSLGLEWVNENIFPLIRQYVIDSESILRTFVEHIAIQISRNLDNQGAVLVTGGGAKNSFLVERITNLSNAAIHIPKSELIDFKEALVFALLGLLRLENRINCLSSVTGAKEDHSSGEIYNPI